MDFEILYIKIKLLILKAQKNVLVCCKMFCEGPSQLRKDYAALLRTPVDPVVGCNIAIEVEVGFITDLGVVKKPVGHSYPCLHVSLGERMMDAYQVRLQL